MKKRYIRLSGVVGMGAVLLVGVALSADAEEHGFYFSADAGVALAEDVDLKWFLDPPPSGTKVKFDTGFRFSVGGGYNFNEYIGIGAETGFIYNSVDKLTFPGGSISDVDASLSHVPMMANVILRYDKPDVKWLPYAGFGAGGDLSILNLNQVEAGDVTVDGTDVDLVFAWQAFAGLRYKITPQMSLGAGYKYYWADDAAWDVSGFGTDSIQIGSAGVHSIVLSFNWSF